MKTAVEALTSYCRTALATASTVGWASYDPFDLLLAPMGEQVRRRSAFAARCVVQAGRRSGTHVRRLLGIEPHEEPKALADFLHTAAILTAIDGSGTEHISTLVHRLETLAIETPSGRGWGLAFPYASRFASVPAHVPNAYTTICCVTALTRATDLETEASLPLAQAGARFITRDLGVAARGSASWFRYWPGNDSHIVNIQALVAGGLQDLAARGDDHELAELARVGAVAAVQAQEPDGRFPYAVDERGRFTDAFHTGFTLEGLVRYRSAGGAVPGLDDAIERGVAFLRQKLVSAGLPLQAPNGRPARDGQNIGELIQVLAVCGDSRDRDNAFATWRKEVQPPSASASLRWELGPLALASAHLAAALAAEPVGH
jgi:hypothetical protein